MKEIKITVVTAPSVKVEIIKETSIWAPVDYVYLIPENHTFLQWARTIHTAEKEKNDWIRKYDNVLKGLQFWKQKALENE